MGVAALRLCTSRRTAFTLSRTVVSEIMVSRRSTIAVFDSVSSVIVFCISCTAIRVWLLASAFGLVGSVVRVMALRGCSVRAPMGEKKVQWSELLR